MSGFTNFRATVSDCPHAPTHDYEDEAKCRAERYAEQKKTGRVEHIVTTDEVPHLWAHKVQDEAHNPKRSLFFYEDTIYSYGTHFPIARHVTNKAGKQAVLFTTAHYSPTTSAHCSHVRSAISHLTVFHVPFVVDMRGDESEHHSANLAEYAYRISQHLLKSARARTEGNKRWLHSRALELRAEAIAYAKFFRAPYAKVLPTVPPIDSVKLQEIKDAENKRLAAERKRIMQENASAIEAWRNGENVRLPLNLPDMLRVVTVRTSENPLPGSLSGAPQQVIETSRGASFPISHAKRGLALVRAVRASGEAWHANGHRCQLGHYRIDSIQPDGTVKAGCHTVKWQEIARIADAIDAAPSVLESLDTPEVNQ